MSYTRTRITAILAAALIAVSAAGATAEAGTPRYGETEYLPDWKSYLEPGETARIPARLCGGHRPSDFHAYDGRTGRAFRQRSNGWYSGRRRVASLWHGTFFTEARRRPIIVAVWCG